MKRRNFLKAGMAAVSAPLIPAGAFAAPAAQTAGWSEMLWATQYARVHGGCSAAGLASHLKMAPEMAEAVFDRLVGNNVITGSGAAIQPIRYDTLAKSMARPGDLARKAKRILKRIDDLTEADDEARAGGPDTDGQWRPREDSNL